MEQYELLASATVSGIIPVKKYKSKDTGFTVCIANVGGPLVNGYFCLATEAHDDDGLPHTLEHLVFMGSEKYPYKGMLDLFANRCLAQGTNAWTDTDHTCYTMTTAGSEGFLNLLPIYLDHVLYPTLTDSAFITEVHHINSCGENAGVVYCEMQGRENTGYSRTFLELQRAMYPGKCGYKSETGGIMKNLRESCSNEKVRNYHKEFYRPENLCLIITGNIEAEDVFQAMRPFEEKIKIKGQLPPYVRPWMSEVPPLDKQEDEKHILFATEDESTGMVLLGWRGPNVLELYHICALKLLFNYLTDTPVAPLQQELVEIDDPFCGDISYHFLENKETAFVLLADSVPKERLFEIKSKILLVLQNLSSGELPFDMDRIKTLLHRQILEEMNVLEDSPHDQLASLSIGDFLYCENSEQLQQYVNSIARLQKLKEEPIAFWTGLLSQYVTDKKIVVIIGDPSEEFMKKSGDEEKMRIKTQAEQLGENGLKEKSEILNKAISENSEEPAAHVVNGLPIPSTDSISFFSIQTVSNKLKATNTGLAESFRVQDFPCRFYFYHISSLFVQVYVLIETSAVPPELQMYLPLYTEIMFESPILKDGKLVPYEEVVKELAADTLQSNASIGMFGGRFAPGSFSSLLVISFKVELDKYEKCVEWIKAVLFDLQFTLERLKIVANKMISDVANYKRNGRKVASILLQDINYQNHTNISSCNMIRQYNFLTQLVKSLDTSSEKVLNDLEKLRKILLREENFRFYVAANAEKLPSQPHVVWNEKLFQNMTYSLDSVKEVPCDSFFSSKQLKRKAVGVGSVESAFLLQTCAGVNSCQHPDYPAILVFIEYLCALEGPLWRQIRGCGYSYSYRIASQPTAGLITFVLAKATHVFKAYETAKKIIENFVSGETPFEGGQIEAAISGTVFQTIEREQTISDTVLQNITAEFKGIEGDFNRVLLKKVSEVTEDDLRRVGQTYFTKLFDPASISVALCSHPTKLEDIVNSFKSIGVEFEIVKSLEDEFST